MIIARQPVSINGVEFDALMQEELTLTAEIPEYSVDSGFSVSDAILLSADELKMTLIASDTPVTWRYRHGENRTATVVDELKTLFYNRTLCTVSTTRRTYTNMAIESVSFPRNETSGTGMEIPITLKQIRNTAVSTTTYPGTYGKSGTTKAAAGAASAENKSADTTKGSDLYNYFNSGSNIGDTAKRVYTDTLKVLVK